MRIGKFFRLSKKLCEKGKVGKRWRFFVLAKSANYIDHRSSPKSEIGFLSGTRFSWDREEDRGGKKIDLERKISRYPLSPAILAKRQFRILSHQTAIWLFKHNTTLYLYPWTFISLPFLRPSSYDKFSNSLLFTFICCAIVQYDIDRMNYKLLDCIDFAQIHLLEHSLDYIHADTRADSERINKNLFVENAR